MDGTLINPGRHNGTIEDAGGEENLFCIFAQFGHVLNLKKQMSKHGFEFKIKIDLSVIIICITNKQDYIGYCWSNLIGLLLKVLRISDGCAINRHAIRVSSDAFF